MANSREKLPAYLKERRVALGLSQAEVAHELGYASAQFISNWERGVSSPPLDKIHSLIEIYKVPRREMIELILEDTRRYLENKIPGAKKSAKRA